ncbi:MAG: CarD family transcriptional regulator [Firmicutes bacterium]|nr:CarD family transcriptional regulator [Bacillota bacterium]
MFSIGDKVVYPMHGAGTIQNIEEKEVLGETRAYYILRIPYGNLQVMVPVQGSDAAGLRPIVSEEAVQDVLGVLSAESTPMDENWNRRYRENMDKLRSGDPAKVAEVIRNLMRVEREKRLSTGEKKLLANARQILASEIVLVRNVAEQEAMDMIDRAV